MPGLDIQLFINATKDAGRLVIQKGGKAVCDEILDTGEVTDLLEAVMNVRADLKDQFPIDLDPLATLPEVADPRWYVPNYTINGSRALVLRHPAIGWNSYTLPQHEANSIAEWLTKPLGPDRPKARLTRG